MRAISDELTRRAGDHIERFPLVTASLGALAVMFIFALSGDTLLMSVFSLLIAVTVLLFAVRTRGRGCLFSLILTVFLLVRCLITVIPVSSCYIEESIRDADINGYIYRVERKLDGSVRYYIKDGELGRLIAYDRSPASVYGTGDIVSGVSDVRLPDEAMNPGAFDYRGYLRSMGINGIIYLDGLEVTGTESGISRISDLIADHSYRAARYCISLFDVEKELAAGVFTGDTSLLEDSLKREFSMTGCSHLLAVSGTHFSSFLLMLAPLMSRKKGKTTSLLFILLCLVIGTFTGWSMSVTRAAVMCLCSYFSRDYLSGLSLSACLVILYDPFAVLSSSFLMSYSAAVAIRLFCRPLEEKMSSYLPSALSGILAVYLSAQTGMALFWSVSGAGLGITDMICRILATCLATFACAFFIPSVILGITMPSELMLSGIRKVVSFGASMSYGDLTGNMFGSFYGIILFLFILSFIMPPSVLTKGFRPAIRLLFAAVTAVFFIKMMFPPDAVIVFSYAGQGNSCLIMTEGKSILIDGGTYENGEQRLTGLLDYYGIRKADLAIMTHLDEDHCGGIACLYDGGRADLILTPLSDPPGTFEYDHLPLEKICKGTSLQISEDCTIRCIYPSADEIRDGGNDDSAVMILECCGVKILFPGDISSDVEKKIRDEGNGEDVDILLAAHHGSRYSNSFDLIEAFIPETAVISCGIDNEYGHPAPETIDRFAEKGTDIYVTSQTGAVIVSIYGNSYKIETIK